MHDEEYAVEHMRELLSALPSAEVRGSTFVAWGDDGGQIYLTMPARRIACSADDLAQLVCDIDWLHWHQADAIGIRFVDDPIGAGVPGGMGGGEVTDALWVHDVMAGSALAGRIAQVIAGQRHSIWPSGSTSIGRPGRIEDIVDLLESEPGDAPAFKTVRRASHYATRECDPTYESRFRGVLDRLLGAPEARNRIAAAELLLFAVAPERVVGAVFEAASGRVGFPSWGLWREIAVSLLGRLARCGAEPARAALVELARSDYWVRENGPRAFCSVYDRADDRYADPAFFRAALSGMVVTTTAEARSTMPKLTRIYTRTGDDGTTGLVGGQRVRKNAQRIEAYGTIDELSSVIGLARTALGDVLRTRPVQDIAHAHAVARELDAWLAWTQDALFNLGSDLATLPKDRWEGMPLVGSGDATALEHAIDRAQQDLEPLANFILPGGSYPGAFLHQARTVCRRAERLLITLGEAEPISPDVVRYVNRLSDALFVWSRWINHALEQPEHLWNAKTAPPEA